MKRVVIDDKKCTKCGACAQRCPFGALKKENGALLHAPRKCVQECEVCWLCCPAGAISYEEFSCGGGAGACEGCGAGACEGCGSGACGGCQKGGNCGGCSGKGTGKGCAQGAKGQEK